MASEPMGVTKATDQAGWKANFRANMDEFVKDAEQQRDEFSLKLHLGKAEARDEWARLQLRIDDLRAKAALMDDEIGVTSTQVQAAAKEALEELKAGLKRLRALF